MEGGEVGGRVAGRLVGTANPLAGKVCPATVGKPLSGGKVTGFTVPKVCGSVDGLVVLVELLLVVAGIGKGESAKLMPVTINSTTAIVN